jgi:hypothetical protein
MPSATASPSITQAYGRFSAGIVSELCFAQLRAALVLPLRLGWRGMPCSIGWMGLGKSCMNGPPGLPDVPMRDLYAGVMAICIWAISACGVESRFLSTHLSLTKNWRRRT